MTDRKPQPIELTIKNFNLRKHKKDRRIEIRLRLLLDTKVCKELPILVRDAYRLVRDTTNNLDVIRIDKNCKHINLEFRETPEQKRSTLRLEDVDAENLDVEKSGDDIVCFMTVMTPIDPKVLAWGGDHFSYNCYATFDLAQLELISAEAQEEVDELERQLGLKERGDEPKEKSDDEPAESD